MPVVVDGELRLRSGSTFRCRIQDLSRDGALVALAQAGKLPKRFFLKIGASEPREIVVAWRNEGEVGVTFLDV